MPIIHPPSPARAAAIAADPDVRAARATIEAMEADTLLICDRRARGEITRQDADEAVDHIDRQILRAYDRLSAAVRAVPEPSESAWLVRRAA